MTQNMVWIVWIRWRGVTRQKQDQEDCHLLAFLMFSTSAWSIAMSSSRRLLAFVKDLVGAEEI
jgi:hypothetical protein